MIFGAAWGWARWLADDRLLAACLTLAIGTGGVSLVMLWLGLLGVPITFIWASGVYLLLMLPGWVLLRGRQHTFSWPALPLLPLAIALGICGAVLLNAGLWPFYRDDTLGIYLPFAAEIASTHGLAPITPQRNLYELYPQLMSMNYAYVFLAAGWENPYAAKMIAALLGVGCLPATYLLARAMFGVFVAWAAVLLLALTPDFGVWASSGYVDLPMAFFYTLGALFTWRLLQTNRSINAILAGVMFGLAAWTKNAALLACLTFFMILTYGLIQRQLSLKNFMLAFVSLASVASPWYMRNLLLSGMLTPDTVWVDQANRGIREMLVLVTRPQNYGLPGWVMLGGVGWSSWRLITARNRVHAVLLAWSVPYFITWLLFASYDPRFTLLYLPFLAVMGGVVIGRIWQWEAIQRRRMPIGAVTIVLLVILAGQTMWNSVEYKRDLLRQPLMTHEMKLDVVQDQE